MVDPKLRLFCLQELFLRETDDEHRLSMREIIARLNAQGIPADRRTVYADLALLQMRNMDIMRARVGRQQVYWLASREFELAELKLLVDAVQASRFLSRKKSSSLISKLECLASRYQAEQMERAVYVKNRVKTDNASVYYSVDAIHEAMQKGKRLSFQYCQYTLSRKLEPRRGGMRYVVTPQLLCWADDNYYLIADHPQHAGLTHYRVDKMASASVCEENAGKSAKLDAAAYARTMFGMYAGACEWVEMAFDGSLIGAVIDRFGADVSISPCEEAAEGFFCRALVAVSPAFYGWMAQFGDLARICSPDSVRLGMMKLLDGARAGYEKERAGWD